MMKRPLIFATLLTWVVGPATAGGAADSALHSLYEQAAARQKVTRVDGGKPGARARYGRYAPVRLRSEPSPVVSVMRLRHLPDGRTVVQCSVEHGPGLATFHDTNPHIRSK